MIQKKASQTASQTLPQEEVGNPSFWDKLKNASSKTAIMVALGGMALGGCKKPEQEAPNTPPVVKGLPTAVISVPENTPVGTKVATATIEDTQDDKFCVTDTEHNGLEARIDGSELGIYTTTELPDSLQEIVAKFRVSDGKENGKSAIYTVKGEVLDDTGNNYTINLVNKNAVSELAPEGTVVLEVRDGNGNLVSDATISGEDKNVVTNNGGVIKLNQDLDGKTFVDPDTGNKFRFTVTSKGVSKTYSEDAGQEGPDNIRSGSIPIDIFPKIQEDSINPTGAFLVENGQPFGIQTADTTYDDGVVQSVEFQDDARYYSARITTNPKSYRSKETIVGWYEEMIGAAMTDGIFDQMYLDNGIPEGWTYGGLGDKDNYIVHTETGFVIPYEVMKKIVNRLANQIQFHGGDPSNFQRWRKAPPSGVYNIGYKMLHNALRTICLRADELGSDGKEISYEEALLIFEKKMQDEIDNGEGKF